jgi:AraC family transcriptional regulator
MEGHMEPSIEFTADRHIVGMSIITSLAINKTVELWKKFMPRRNEIRNVQNDYNLYDMQVYEAGLDLTSFTPDTQFEQWAGVEVSGFENIPEGMESRTIKGGEYAVFIHKGAASEFHETSNYIFRQWLPSSKYNLDDRDHFQIMGKKYLGPANPNSEEEVWVPIK